MVILRDGRKVLYQWDLNAKAVVKTPGVDELHFQHSKHPGDAWVVDVSQHGIAAIPNLCLQEAGKLYVYESIGGERTGTYSIITVQPRAKPSDYVYTEVEIKRYEQLELRVDEIAERMEDIETGMVDEISNLDIDRLMEM